MEKSPKLKPKPHILKNCQNKKGENIGIASPESDQILAVRRNVYTNELAENVEKIPEGFDQIVNLNGNVFQEELTLKFGEFSDKDVFFKKVKHEIIHHIGWVKAQEIFGNEVKNFSTLVELVVGGIDLSISNNSLNLFSDKKIDNLYYFIFQSAIEKIFEEIEDSNDELQLVFNITRITSDSVNKYNRGEDIVINYSSIDILR